MCVCVCVCVAVGDGGEMTGFHSSLSSDQAAVASVCQGLHGNSVSSFVSALSACTGTIFTSGIGQPSTNHLSLANVSLANVSLANVSLANVWLCVCRQIWSSSQSVLWFPQLTWHSLSLCFSCRMDARRSGYVENNK